MTSWHVRDMDVANQVRVVANGLNDITFLNLSVVNVHENADAWAADLFQQTRSVLKIGDLIAWVVTLDIEGFEVIDEVVFFSDFGNLAECLVGCYPPGCRV